MPKIVIDELDLTSPGRNAQSTDIVYIPGFVDVKNNFLSTDYKNALPMNTPTLFTDVATFESMCGARGAVFTDTQYYKNVADLGGFADEAVPYNGVMFAPGTVDPAYVMAKELLNMGLNVLYERVNPDVDTGNTEYIYINSGSAPADWDNIKDSCEIKKDVYEDVFAPSMPEMTSIANGTVYNASTEYLTRSVVKNVVTYTVVAIPEDDRKDGVISSATTTYYTKDTQNTYYIKSYVAELPSEEEFPKHKYFKKDEGFYTPLSTRPDVWPDNVYEFVVNTLTEGQGSPKTYTISQSWVDEWVLNGVVSSKQWVVNAGEAFQPNTEYRVANPVISINQMYTALIELFDSTDEAGLIDRGNFSFKYMTSGGYPVYEFDKGSLVTKMLAVAEKRGDCVAIIDHTDNINRDNNIAHTDSLYYTVANDDTWKTNGEFATMFTSWATYTRVTNDRTLSGALANNPTQVRLPASFAYLMALADSIKTNANWLAIAGAARGGVMHLAENGMTTIIPNGVADKMQPRDGVAINPITNINPYGNIIWGNRTLKDNADQGNLTATSFLNIRNLVSDVKKQCYSTARQLTFEQNNDILWVNFKALMNPLLDTMLSGYGISGYKMVKDVDRMRELGYPKATLCVKIILFPVYAVEDFYIRIVLKDDDVSVAEA